MNQKSSYIFRMIAGAYLIYQGGSLLIKVVQDRPEHFLLFALISAVFILVGGIFFCTTVKKFVSSEREEIEIKSYQGDVPGQMEEDGECTEDVQDGKEDKSCV